MTDESKLEIFSHLYELRKRLLISIAAIGVGFTVCFVYSDVLLKLLMFPLNYQPQLLLKSPFFQLIHTATNIKLHFVAPAEAFWTHLKIAMVFALLIASPIVIFQIWLFIKPALFAGEQQIVTPLIFTSIFLFLAGVVFCYGIVLPFALNFLITYKTQDLVPMLTIEHYIDFTLKFILAFGLVFQTPIVLVLLTKLNILTPKSLRENRKYAILIIFIIAAILTPTPDVFNQCIMAVPMMLLYELGIIISSMLYKKTA